MKLIYYGVSEEEIAYIERWQFIHKTPVTIVMEGLSWENIHLAAGLAQIDQGIALLGDALEYAMPPAYEGVI